MPSGKTHIKINWAILLLANAGMITCPFVVNIYTFIIFNVCFILASYFISPDLDIYSSVYKRWGILKLIWWPYRELMKHRGWSHSIILGPASILIYLGFWILPGILAMVGFLPIEHFSGLLIEIGVIMTFCIICICEIHIFADKIL